MSNPVKDIGPCVVVWDGAEVDGPAVTFHKTFGGVFFRYEELQVPVKRDQAGETEVSAVTTGVTNPELEVPLTQEDCARLQRCFANAVAGSTGGVDYLKVRNPVGKDIFPFARQVIVKRIEDGIVSTTQGEWLYIHRAFPRITMEQGWDNTAQRTVKVMFKGYPDDISGRQHEMWRYGPD